MAADGKKYVVYGMKAKCSEGSMENYISTDVGHGVLYQGQPLLNANDHMPQVNLTHFGDCHSRKIYEEAKKQADEKYKVDGDDGFFEKAGKLIAKTVTKAAISVKENFAVNKCELDTPLPWMFVNKEHMIDGAPALTVDSQCACRYGGIITIVQEDTEKTIASNTDEEFENLVQEFIETVKNDSHNYSKLKELALKISETDTANRIENQVFSMIQPIITPLLAFDYVGNNGDIKENSDFYHTMDNYGIQRIAGFCDIYDELQWVLGMDLDTRIVTFTPEGSDREYRLQFWKGSYGAGTAYGGEIGFYYREQSLAEIVPYGTGNPLAYYICIDQKEEIETVQKIYDVHTGELLMVNDTSQYTEDGQHFWNLAIRTDPWYNAEDLFVVEELIVEDEAIREAMLEALYKDKDLEVMEYLPEENKIVVKFTH